ncbi:MAG: zinc dependent phospholipase C family protein [Myxococcota bacterium]
MLSIALLTADASAYTTRVHIALANEIHAALLASGDGSIALLGGEDRVTLAPEDANAILDNPLAFRAGSIGPDNFVFPALTDQTHGLGLRPYDQCEDLYEQALDDAEKAYALGCFLHGASDAVVHHYINFLSGETFTLTPITAEREDSIDNAVRHIVAEAMLQDAALELRPDLFEAARMMHDIPNGFVERELVNLDGRVWARMVSKVMPKILEVQDDFPALPLVLQIGLVDLTPSEQLALLPLYIQGLAEDMQRLGPLLEEFVVGAQDWSVEPGATLQVTAGSDGVFGTSDDETDCSWGCPEMYVGYFTAIALLEERADHDGPAWIEIIEDLGEDLASLPAVYVLTVGNVSAELTDDLVLGEEPVDIETDAVTAAFEPLELWIEDTLSLSDDVVEQLLPDWILDIRDWLHDTFGIEINLGAIVNELLEPLIEPIKDAIRQDIETLAEDELGYVLDEIDAQIDPLTEEFRDRLVDAAPPDLEGTVLDHLFDSGLWMGSFNNGAVALSDPSMVLPIDDAFEGVGGASFDASYSVSWMQVSRCPVGEAAFPLGYDVRGLLSVRDDGGDHQAADVGDAPIECHDGALDAFGTPSPAACAIVSLDELEDGRSTRGSLSRAFPPEAVDVGLVCGGFAMPELPPPDDAACSTGPASATAWIWLVVLGLARRRWWGAPALAASACGWVGPAGSDRSSDAVQRAAEAGALADSLGRTVWHGEQVRDGKVRPVELQFRADLGIWAEVVSPYGPSRKPQMRSLVPIDGTSFRSVGANPEGWPVGVEDGARSKFDVGLGADLTLTRGGATETWSPGPVADPSGFTAYARGFAPEGEVDDGFCDAIIGIDSKPMLDFARGDLLMRHEEIAFDVATGVPLGKWPEQGNFSLSAVPGFATTDLDLNNRFMVRYRGTIDHPGGTLSVRERDDEVHGLLWVFAGDAVDHGTMNDVFLEVHSLVWLDETSDEPSASFPAGPLELEVIVLYCEGGSDAVEVEIRQGGGWTRLDLVQVTPHAEPRWFQPRL